jgi:hypothetical protein
MNRSRRIFLERVPFAISALSYMADAKSRRHVKVSAGQSQGRFSFQTSAPWSPRLNLNADAALVYGIGATLPERMSSWRSRGYRIDVMTGIAWGRYQNYLDGQFDGVKHEDEAQADRFGKKIRHGSQPAETIYYMVPAKSYVRYVAAGLKQALDAGAEAICLEEPEFWVRAGYSEAFKREWQAYYREAWAAPYSSPDAQYRASKLKYYLYRRALSEAFGFVHRYAKTKGRRVNCYVATHSLPNYSQWRIVSPESSLEQVRCDGYIAQVWTGTARTPNVYEGRKQERTFETAFLEYGAMVNFSRVSGRAIWLLNDPVEDNPNHSWTDYRKNWECTMAASLLHPQTWRYEIMPWPERVFGHKYPVESARGGRPGRGIAASLESGNGYPASAATGRRTANLPERILIPQDYATELQAVIEALREMRQPRHAVRWERCGTQGAGILVSDTMMFQRGDPHPSDANLGSFYGLALPLLMRGLPVKPVQIEYATQQDFLKPYRLLLLTYEGQKPPAAHYHEALANWVRGGGALVVIDNDQDPYNSVREWWNTPPLGYPTPRFHLFETLGLKTVAAGLHRAGKGVVLWQSQSPAALSYRPDGSQQVARFTRAAAEAVGLPWRESRTLVLRRGPYIIAAGLDTPASSEPAPPLRGRYIDLFDGNLPLVSEAAITPGRRMLLLDLDAFPERAPCILAAACRISKEIASDTVLRFRAEGIAGTEAVVRVALPRAAKKVMINATPASWKASGVSGGTLRIRFPNSAEGVEVRIEF